MKSVKCKLAVWVLEIAAILLLHLFLLHWFAGKNVVASILAADKHVPRLTIVLAIVFFLIRLLAVFLLPGMILSRFGILFYDLWMRKGEINES